MLALADRFGDVAGTVPGIASQAHVPLESARAAIERLESPDPDSRTPDHEGRRIKRISGGWNILNHKMYRDLQGKDLEWQKLRHRKNQAASYQRNTLTNSDRPRSENADSDRPRSKTDRFCPTVTTDAEADTDAYSKKGSANSSSSTSLASEVEQTDDRSPNTQSVDLKTYKPPQLQLTEIYKGYPRKVAPRKAKEAIAKAILRLMHGENDKNPMPPREAAVWLYRAVFAYAGSKFVQTAPMRAIPHPTTWFNQSRYDDDRKEWDQAWIGEISRDRNIRSSESVRRHTARHASDTKSDQGIGLADLLGTSAGTNGRSRQRVLPRSG